MTLELITCYIPDEEGLKGQQTDKQQSREREQLRGRRVNYRKVYCTSCSPFETGTISETDSVFQIPRKTGKYFRE